MIEMKIQIETYFKDNWTQTPIHYQGMRFIPPSTHNWVSITFTPIDRESHGSGCIATDIAQVRVLSYGNTPNASLELDGDVGAFLENYSWNSASIVGARDYDGLGILDMENGAFETSSLYSVMLTK